MKSMKIFRQGDVLLKATKGSKELQGKKMVSGKGQRIVLAYGEVTGHAHAIYNEGAVLTETENGRFLDILADAGVDLEHEEHDTITLEPGRFEVIQQREYSPEAIRRVVD